MLKLKQKIQHYKAILTLAVIVLVFLLPGNSGAATPANFDNSSMVFTVGTQVGSKQDNWISAVSGQPVTFTVLLSIDKLTDLVSGNPVNALNIGTDTIDLHTSTSGRWTISELGVGVDVVGDGNQCTIEKVFSGILLGDTAKIMTCDFQGRKFKVQTTSVPVGNKVAIQVTLDSGAVSALKLDRPCGWDKGKFQEACFGIYPYMTLQGTVRADKDFAPNSLGKAMYISFFPDASTAAAAQRPADLPGYGDRTGSPDATGSGDYLLGFINKIIMFILGLVNEIVYFLFYWLIAPLIQALLSIHTYKDNFVNVIYPGWEVVRNVCNIFFIIAIIGIALATLFRLEGYQYRHLLVQLILAALLVNFSLVIAQAILALADTIQNQFLPNNIEVIRSLARDLMVANTRDAVLNLDVAKYGQFSYTVISFFWVSLSVGSFAVFAGLCAYLVIRVVMLWVLLMVSPIAFVGGILPSTAGLRNQWWEYFLKYAFFTPIMAFMLNMTAIISNSVRQNTFLQNLTSADFSDSNVGSLNVFIFKVGGNLMILVFLMVAIKVAEEMGIYGASAISEIANKGVMSSMQPWKWPGSKMLNDYKTRKSLEWTKPDAHGNVGLGKKLLFGALNPLTTVKGFQHQSEEKRKRLHSIAEGAAFDINRQVFGGQPSEERDEGQDHQAAEYKKHNPYRTTEQIVAHFNEIGHISANKLEKEIAYEATIEQAAENKDLNDILMSQGFTADRDGYLKFMNELVSKGKISEGRAARLAEKLTKHAYANQEFWYGWGSRDGHLIKQDTTGTGKSLFQQVSSGRRDFSSLTESEKQAYMYQWMINEQQSKFKKKEPQDIARNLHHSAVREMNSNGSVKGLTEVAADMVVNADDRLYAQADRANAEQLNAFISVIGSPDAENKVAQAMIDQYGKQNITLTPGQAQKQAKDKIQEFSTKYLRYDTRTGVRLKKDKEDPVDVMIKVDNLNPEFKTINKDDRDDVKKHIRDVLQKPSEFSMNFPPAVDTLVSNPGAKIRIQNSAVKQLSTTLAKNLSIKELVDDGALPSGTVMNLTAIEGVQNDIRDAIKTIILTNPGLELKNPSMQTNLKSAIVSKLSTTPPFNALSTVAQEKIADKILVTTK